MYSKNILQNEAEIKTFSDKQNRICHQQKLTTGNPEGYTFDRKMTLYEMPEMRKERIAKETINVWLNLTLTV